MKVIDISDEQNGLNFDLVKQAGVKGCIVQVCEGTELLAYYPKFFNACRAQNFYFGASCVSVAGDEEDAEYEAETLMKAIEQCGVIDPSLYLWIVLDPTLSELMDGETLASVVNAFVSACNQKGFMAGVSADEDTFDKMEKAGLNKGMLKWCVTENGTPKYDIDCWNKGTETIGARKISVNEFN